MTYRLTELPERTVVDGEIVALDDFGRPDFNLLQQFRSEASRICYFIFDLLVYQDRDLTRLPLTARRRLLHKQKSPRNPEFSRNFAASMRRSLFTDLENVYRGVCTGKP